MNLIEKTILPWSFVFMNDLIKEKKCQSTITINNKLSLVLQRIFHALYIFDKFVYSSISNKLYSILTLN